MAPSTVTFAGLRGPVTTGIRAGRGRPLSGPGPGSATAGAPPATTIPATTVHATASPAGPHRIRAAPLSDLQPADNDALLVKPPTRRTPTLAQDHAMSRGAKKTPPKRSPRGLVRCPGLSSLATRPADDGGTHRAGGAGGTCSAGRGRSMSAAACAASPRDAGARRSGGPLPVQR